MKYTIIETLWGQVLVVASSRGVAHLRLPDSRSRDLGRMAQRLVPGCTYDVDLLPELQDTIRQYFEGHRACFHVALDLSGLSAFASDILRACKNVPYGHWVTYKQLAELGGYPGAARAVGGVMARNPIPLIIPCHRVIRSDRSLGGFSSEGGLRTKRRLLDLETTAATPPGVR